MSGETQIWTKKSFGRLDKIHLVEATNWLCMRDKDLSLVVKQIGIPPLWQRPEGFCTLLFLILEQQVSLASARATFMRLVEYLKKRVTPDQFLTLQISELQKLGFSITNKTNTSSSINWILNINPRTKLIYKVDIVIGKK